MIFNETKLKGAYIIELEPIEDERGFFARSFCQREFEEHRLNPRIVQCNISYNRKKGTLRGMHYQVAPYEEAKLVSCIRGAIYDVIVDLRENSPTYCQWIAVVLHGFNASTTHTPIHPSTDLPIHPSTDLPIHPSTDLPIHPSTDLPIHPSTHKLLYIPKGFAHGFQTLENNTIVFYQMSEFYHPECARGVRWDDPVFKIEWPMPNPIMSEKDKSFLFIENLRIK